MCDNENVWNAFNKTDKHKVSFPNMCLWLSDLLRGLIDLDGVCHWNYIRALVDG